MKDRFKFSGLSIVFVPRPTQSMIKEIAVNGGSPKNFIFNIIRKKEVRLRINFIGNSKTNFISLSDNNRSE